MKFFTKPKHRKLLAILALGTSALLFAAAVFLPSTQPTVTLGKYVLVNPDLASTENGTIAYRPWFENGAWQGDIIEYEITKAGDRLTDASVETTPAASGTSGMCGRDEPLGCWSARAKFIALGADIPDGTYWQNRKIITTDGAGTQVPFTWDKLTQPQRDALDQDAVDMITAAKDPSLNDDPYYSVILDFIRGERINERSNDGFLRTRYSVLGDITNTPVYIGPPREQFGNIPGYYEFASDNTDRAGRVAAGSNDGMLHIFDVDDGSEVFAYIPSMVIDKLDRLAARYEAYSHTYYVDGEPNASSAQINGVWRTILTGGGGAGFAGLYALDMTDPDLLDLNTKKVLFEKSATDVDSFGKVNPFDFGYIYGKPQIAPLGVDDGTTNWHPNWYIITGNGYSTDNSHPTKLMFISLDDPDTVYTVTCSGVTGGLSTATLVSTDSDNIPDLAFAGDIKGNLWMFEINQTNPESSTATMVYAAANSDQPITAAPIVAEHPNRGGLMVYFGTGSILSMDDALNDGKDNTGKFTKTQAIYGIWVDTSDMETLKSGLPYHSSTNLQTQTVDEATYTVTGQQVRYLPSEKPVTYLLLNKGWKVNLPDCGERLVGDPFLRAGRLQFVTTNPTGLSCGERTLQGNSWEMSLDYITGGDNGSIVYNLNGDGSLDSKDTVSIDDVEKPPVGLNLGPGNISQPAFARLEKGNANSSGVDKMFINGLIMSVPIPNPGPLLGGHLDVETDSPSDGVIATNDVSKHSEGYMVPTGKNDGLGKAVDGHVHDYDGIHDVNYVDLFQLEPRRGKANLVATLVDLTNAPTAAKDCNSSTPNWKSEPVKGKCLQLIEGELNRAYDTLHTDGDGVMHPNNGPNGPDGKATPVWQSEVNSFEPDPAFTNPVTDKEFIVVLANADLSNAGVLQIGCKVWPVVEYQNMITAKLQAMSGAGSITPETLKDNDGDSLVFTLDDIMSANPSTCPGGANAPDGDLYSKENAIAKGLSPTPTLRIGFGTRSILDGGIHPTRSQCVLGLHNYDETVCYTDQEVLTASTQDNFKLLATEGYTKYSSCTGLTPPTPPLNYLRDPKDNLHVTEIQGKGWRWRNGALTLQLIDAGINPAEDLQIPATMVKGAGTFAQAFTVSGHTFTNTSGNSGMLYEATMFWHYSDLVDKSRNEDPVNNPTPPEAGCYAGPGYGGKSGGIESNGANPAEVKNLLKPLLKECADLAESNPDNKTCLLGQYLNLLQIIGTAETEEIRNNALVDLANLLAGTDELSKKVKELNDLWEYIPDDQKPDIGDLGSPKTLIDGTPAKVISVETIDLKSKGPNYVYGRRNWIDLRQ